VDDGADGASGLIGVVGKASSRGALWLLLIASLINALNYYDRYVISILVEDLKREFALSDSQIGILSGLAFALVYSVAAVPIARFADRGRHARVLGASALIWSLMSGACGLATGFWSFFLARFGVGLGESGGMPSTQALVARRFSLRARGTAFAMLNVSATVGIFAALSGGGWIALHYGWRAAFYLGSGVGVVLALIMLATVRDLPPAADGAKAAAPPIGFSEAIAILVRRRAFVWQVVGLTIGSIGAYAMIAWTPAYLMRQFALDSAQVGAGYSAKLSIGTLIGTLLGGIIGDRLARRDARAPFHILAFSFGLTAPLQIAFFLVGYQAALAMTLGASVIAGFWISPSAVAIQSLAGPRLGATAAAIFAMFVNLGGQALGPSVVGWLSDALAPVYGRESLRWALIFTCATFAIATIAFLLAARTARADIAAAEVE
jgi:MFS family permease